MHKSAQFTVSNILFYTRLQPNHQLLNLFIYLFFKKREKVARSCVNMREVTPPLRAMCENSDEHIYISGREEKK